MVGPRKFNGKSGDPHGQGVKQGGPQEVTNLGYRTVLEAPAYLLNPQSQVTYTYDAVGNRLSMTDDDGTTDSPTCMLGPRAEAAGNARHSLKRQGKGSHRDVCSTPTWGTSSLPIAVDCRPGGWRIDPLEGIGLCLSPN